MIRNGWNVRDLQAIYPAPPVPSFSKIAKAVIVGGGLTTNSAAAVALIVKQFRDAVSNSWQSVQAELVAAYERCPSRKILFAGYSQGAILLRYIVPRLEAKILKQIVSVDLFADPTEQRAVDWKLQHPAKLDGKLTTEGLDTLSGGVVNGGSFLQTPYPGQISGRTYQYCADGDLVCDVNLSNLAPSNLFNEGKIHASYEFLGIGAIAGKRAGRAPGSTSPGDAATKQTTVLVGNSLIAKRGSLSVTYSWTPAVGQYQGLQNRRLVVKRSGKTVYSASAATSFCRTSASRGSKPGP